MGAGALRALKVAVVVMGVLIVGGTALLGVLIAGRMSGRPGRTASAILDEPPGTRLIGASLAGQRLALALHGAGPDRVVVVDVPTGHVVARVSLRR